MEERKYISHRCGIILNAIFVRGGGTVEASESEVYLNPSAGSDANTGADSANAVKSLDKAVELAGEGGTICVINQIEIKDAGTVEIGKVTLKLADEWDGPVGFEYLLNVKNSNLILNGTTLDGNQSTLFSGMLVSIQGKGSTLTINEGTVIKNHKFGSGNAVSLSNGAVCNMYGGEIRDNESGAHTAGVVVNTESVFNMYGGSIKNNTSGQGGGGVLVQGYLGTQPGGTFNMYGGTIEENTAQNSGGGLKVYGTANLLGGEIKNNDTPRNGGGVYIEGYGETVLDGTKITGNTAGPGNSTGGAGIYILGRADGTPTGVGDSGPKLTIKSGSITGNNAENTTHGGGAIFAWNYSTPVTIEISGGTIKDNKGPDEWNGSAIRLLSQSAGSPELRLSGAPEISGSVRMDSSNTIKVTGKFEPVSPVMVYDGVWKDYRPVIEYASGLTPELSDFTVRGDKPRYGYLKDGQDLQSINRLLVTFQDGEKECGTAYVNPKEEISADAYPVLEKEGYSLAGWMTESGDIWEAGDQVTKDLTLKAVWRENLKVTPADMTIYTGGDSGYTGVVSDENGVFTTSNSLPDPAFTVALPQDMTDDAVSLVFKEKSDSGSGFTGKEWKLEPYGEGSTTLYRLVASGNSQDPVRVVFTDDEGNNRVDDSFDINTAFSEKYSIRIYPGTVEQGRIVAVASDGTEYTVETEGMGTLTVRGVTGTEEISEITADEPEKTLDTITAAAPKGTEYTINDSNVKVGADAKPSLLNDSIARGEEAESLLTDRAETELGEDTSGMRRYEFRYLDLVDANNGNMWISSSNGVDLYWPYPEGTNENTEFTILHYKGLHRDAIDETNISDQIAGCEVEKFTAQEKGDFALSNTEFGVMVHIGKGGFSPFALVWDESETPDDEQETPGQDITKPGQNNGNIEDADNKVSQEKKAVETADHANIWLWVALCAISMSGAAGVIVRTRRRPRR